MFGGFSLCLSPPSALFWYLIRCLTVFFLRHLTVACSISGYVRVQMRLILCLHLFMRPFLSLDSFNHISINVISKRSVCRTHLLPIRPSMGSSKEQQKRKFTEPIRPALLIHWMMVNWKIANWNRKCARRGVGNTGRAFVWIICPEDKHVRIFLES